MQTKILGEFGELLVSKRLESKGHKILRTRYKKWEGEIDVVSYKDGIIYFTEVKTRIVRKRAVNEVSLQDIGITRHKMSKIIKCAQYFTQNETNRLSYTGKQFDAYYLQAICDNNIKNVSTLSSMKQYFIQGKIRILVTIMENIDREVFGFYGTNLMGDKD